MEETQFTVETEGKNYSFSINSKGLVSLHDGDDIIDAVDFGQEAPVKTMEEAKETAKIMLFALGKITSF